MMLRFGSMVLVAVGMVGCTGGVVDGTGVGGNGEATADVRLESRVAKKRDLAPAKSGAERIARAASAKTGLTVAPLAVASGTQPALTYRNGPVLQSVEVYAVFWGSNVSTTVQNGVNGFFSGITSAQSPIQQMLAQYNTNGMTIGNGSFKGAITDADAPMPSNNIITNAMIEAEGARLVDTGKVPAEDGKNILMFFFPPGVAIDQGGGTMSCQVFCAYHSTFTRNGNNFFYGVIPDQNSGGCEQGCGLTTDALKTTYSTTSHELIEAITDAAVGVNDLAWYDDTFGEIGDVCVEWDGMSNNYYVQSEWSNADKACTDHSASTHAAIDVTYDTAAVTAPGANATFNLTSSGNASGNLTLETAGLFTGMGGFTAAFSPATPAVGGSSTLTVGVPAGMRSQDATFKVAATDSNGAHHFAQVTLHVKGAAPTLTSATPATGPSQGGNTVDLVGTNIGPGATAKICSSTSTTCSTAIPANGSYTNGSGGTKFSLVMPSHTAAAAGTTVKIWVTNPNDPSNPAKISYKYTTGAAPTVAAVSPPSGPTAGGTFVTVTGTNFSSNSTLKFGTSAVDCSAASQTCAIVDDKTIILLTPAGTGSATVTVTNADGLTGNKAAAFKYGTNPPPSVANLSLDTGPTAGGTYVTIFGDNFDATPTVTFGGVAAQVKTVNPSFLGVVTPAHAAGMVDVVVANGDAQSAKGAFTYADGTGGTGGGGGGGAGGTGGGDDMGGGGGSGGGGGDGTGGNGGAGGGGGGPVTVTGNNALTGSSGCTIGGNGDAASVISLVLVFAALAFALRRQRS